ncbi:hypothetical protein [Flavobacterium sp. 7A]|uniref:hypothetical protein n=1 Tax=Flavobacterium sp. 7A TaxID=2940571 RepID=UPI00222704CC|nr:hypothetical protein [Flavobacterium sp. 7A]MCW2120221.1 hypothetical protein [Flavobacterium sp. 7A]
MEKVIFKEGVLQYFDDLVVVLFRNDYFAYLENANKYMEKIVDFATHEILAFHPKKRQKSLVI